MHVRLTELGVYKFREMRSPDGYVLDETTYIFELRDDGRIDGKLTLTNHREDGSTTKNPVPQTDVYGNKLLLIILISVAAATTIAIPTVMYRKEILARIKK